jgi:UDP-glucose 4-epimerase
VACQTALGQRPGMDVFGTDYDTPDGTCLRDYIHVSDLIAAHMDALGPSPQGRRVRHLQLRLWQGLFGARGHQGGGTRHGAPVKHTLGPRRAGDPAGIVAGADKVRKILGWQPRHDDLDFIVESALNWERHLERRNAA